MIVSLNSSLESNKEEEEDLSRRAPAEAWPRCGSMRGGVPSVGRWGSIRGAKVLHPRALQRGSAKVLNPRALRRGKARICERAGGAGDGAVLSDLEFDA